MIGIERHQKSAEIGNVLTQSLTAVDMKSRQYFIAIELMRQLLGPLLEMLGIGGSPPVMQSPDCVNFAALIVKPMDDFVANTRMAVSFASACRLVISLIQPRDAIG